MSFLGATLKTAMFMGKNIKFVHANMNIFLITHYTSNKQQFDGGESGIFCLFVGDNHARFGVLRNICSIFTYELFCKPFPQQEFEPPLLF